MGSGAETTRLKSCSWASVEALIRRTTSGQKHRQCLAFTAAAGRSQPRPGHRLACGSDRIEWIGLRTVAARGPLRAVQLDDDLRVLQQMATQAGAVTPG